MHYLGIISFSAIYMYVVEFCEISRFYTLIKCVYGLSPSLNYLLNSKRHLVVIKPSAKLQGHLLNTARLDTCQVVLWSMFPSRGLRFTLQVKSLLPF